MKKRAQKTIAVVCLAFLLVGFCGCGEKNAIFTTGGDGGFGENPAKPGSYAKGNSPLTQPADYSK